MVGNQQLWVGFYSKVDDARPPYFRRPIPVNLKVKSRAWFQHRPHDRRANTMFVPTKPHLPVVGANLVFAHLPAELNFGRR